MKKLFVLGLMLVSVNTHAFSRSSKAFGGTLTISPVIGFERVQKFHPTPRMETRATYGASALYTFNIISFEAEYTTANDSHTESLTNVTYKDEEQKLSLGVRGSFRAGQFVNWYLRGGAQGRRNTTTTTENATATVLKDTTSKVQPYVGTGVEFRLFSAISLSGDVVATYAPTDDPNLSDIEYRPTVSFNVKF